jgi:hypothetical protein
MSISHTPTIRVDFTGRDCFSSMTVARHAGRHIAEEGRPSELIVCNAYHDVVEITVFPAPA